MKKLYQLGNKHGLLDTKLSVNAFGVMKQNVIQLKEVNINKRVGIREMARLCSIEAGQGYIKRACAGECKNFKCVKAKQICNSRCHGKEANSNCKNIEKHK